MARSKSQSESTQSFDDILSAFREVLKVSNYRHALEHGDLNLGKHYIDGDLALILHFAAGSEIEKECSVPGNGEGIPCNDLPILILHNDVLNNTNAHQWSQQPVLIRNVQIVKEFEKTIPTDYVRLYIGDNPVKESRAKNVYFSILERVFYVLPGLPSGEFGVTVQFRNCMPLDGAEVSVLHGNPQIVDSISDNHSHFGSDFGDIRRKVLDCFSAFFIRLDCRSVSIWKRGNNCRQFRNMFLGPFNFVSGCGESINHNADSSSFD